MEFITNMMKPTGESPKTFIYVSLPHKQWLSCNACHFDLTNDHDCLSVLPEIPIPGVSSFEKNPSHWTQCIMSDPPDYMHISKVEVKAQFPSGLALFESPQLSQVLIDPLPLHAFGQTCLIFMRNGRILLMAGPRIYEYDAVSTRTPPTVILEKYYELPKYPDTVDYQEQSDFEPRYDRFDYPSLPYEDSPFGRSNLRRAKPVTKKPKHLHRCLCTCGKCCVHNQALTQMNSSVLEAAIDAERFMRNKVYSGKYANIPDKPEPDIPSPFARWDDYSEQGDMETERTPDSHATETQIPLSKNPDIKTADVVALPLQGETALSETAIDSTSVVPGETSSRMLMDVITPSGPVKAIVMTDHDSISYPPQKYLMHGSPPQWSLVWEPCSVTGSANRVVTGKVNTRLLRQMDNFKQYSGLGLWKLVAPIPLFTSQRFWVSFLPLSSASTAQDGIGFEWNPTEESEIYVITPWTGTTRCRDFEKSGFVWPDRLYITPMTDIVFTEGLPTSIDIKSYFVPYDLSLYTPIPVSDDTVYTKSWNQNITKITNTSTLYPYIIYAKVDNSVTYTVTFTNDATDESVTILSGSYDDSFKSTFVRTNPVPPGTWTLKSTVDTDVLTMNMFSAGPIETVTTRQYEEQIGGLEYDPSNSVASLDMGAISNHTSRLDSHWGLVDSLPISSLDDQLLFKIFNPTENYCFSDMYRHLFTSKCPAIQIRATSVPSANLHVRITQLPPYQDSVIPLTQALQLPGIEMNVKSGDLKVEPYFNLTPVVRRQFEPESLNFQVDVLGGSIATEAVYITVFQNVKSLEYYHLFGPTQTPSDYEEQGAVQDPQIESQTVKSSVDSEEVGVTNTERRWQYLTSFQIQPSTAAVSIPLDKLFLGDHFYRHLRRYALWRGRPRVKVMLTNARILSGNAHITQTNNPVPDKAVSPYILFKDIGYSVLSPADPAIQLDIKWRNPNSWLQTSSSENLGYLNIIVPELSVGSGPIPQNLVVTLHVDTSDIELKIPQAPSSLPDYTPVAPSSMPRVAPSIF